MARAPYFRANVGVAVINHRAEILALERWPRGSRRWQMVQGGIDAGEEPEDAAYRELEEEIGLSRDQVFLVAEMPEWLSYELPQFARTRPGGLGQTQKWFLFRLGVDESAIDLGVEEGDHRPELVSWRWTTLDRLAAETWEPRRPIYRRLAREWKRFLEPNDTVHA